MSAWVRIVSVAALCTIALVALVVVEGIARRNGQEILLEMAAVDPRSMLSGHYVDINLTERLEPGEECPPDAEETWMSLGRGEGGVYTLIGGAPSREMAQLVGPLPVRGSFTCQPPIEMPDAEPTAGWVWLDIGVRRFHINQRDALRIERILRDQNPSEPTRAFAIVSVGRDGRARLKGIVVDGERLELSWL